MNSTFDDLSIMYNTCFTYKNLWDPFFTLKKKYFQNQDIITYLCSDGNLEDYFKTKQMYDNTQFIQYPDEAYSSGPLSNYVHRLLYYLEKIPTNYIIYWYDDMFLTNFVDFDKLSESFELMKKNSNIKTIKLSSCSYPFTGKIYYKNNDFTLQQNSHKDQYCINLQPSLFNKNFLIDLCKNLIQKNAIYDGSFDIENAGTPYFHQNPNNISLRSNINIIPVFSDCGIVSAGYVRKGALDFLKNENIHLQLYDNFIYEKSTETVSKLSKNNQHYLKCNKLI